MSRTLRFSAVFLLSVLSALSSSAQDRPLVGTVIDVDEGRGRIQVQADTDQTSRITVEIDSVATTWKGFGTLISGKPEIFTGSAGLSNVRLGDRVDVRGSRTEGVIRASQITLLGRPVPAPQVGVGQTRTPTNVATPTEEQARAAAATSIEGTIRQINTDEGRLVIQTPRRGMISVTTSRATPVWFEGEQYRVANLEVGDQIRIEIDPVDATATEIVARRIDVTQSVQSRTAGSNGRTVTIISGRISRVEPTLNFAYVNDGRTEIRVDMSQAEDGDAEPIRARDLHADERVEISGSYNDTGDIFLASTVRFAEGVGRGPIGITRYAVVTFTGTVAETLEDGPTIAVQDRDLNSLARIWTVDDLVVRTRSNATTTANLLRVGDTVVVQAFRDDSGNLIAQTIRLRNR